MTRRPRGKGAPRLDDHERRVSRRSFLLLTAGATAALAARPDPGLADALVAPVRGSPVSRPSELTLFATVCRECPAGCGMHARHIDGRAIKAEGNPLHPVGRGALCARGQSSVQGLFDPDRVRHPLRRLAAGETEPATWEQAVAEIAPRLRDGRVALLSDLQTGALAEVMERFVAAFGSDRLLFYEPFNYEALRAAHARLYGRPEVPLYQLHECEFVLSFGAEFLGTWVSPVQYAEQFTAMHAPGGVGGLGRLAFVGPLLTQTAANADDLLLVPPAAMPHVAAAILQTVLARGWARDPLPEVAPMVRGLRPLVPEGMGERIEALARRFGAARGSVALAGPAGALGEPAIRTAELAALLNQAVGAPGRAVRLDVPHALSRTALREQTRRFLAAIGPEDVLIVHQANPAYSFPGAAAALERAGLVVFLGTHVDATALLAGWVLPTDSPLESWGDYEPWPGLHGLMQPASSRLYATRGSGDILLALAAQAGRPLAPAGAAEPPARFQDWLRRRWGELGRRLAPEVSADEFWTQSLRRGGAWADSPPTARHEHEPGPEPERPRPPDWPAAGPESGVAPAPGLALELWAWPAVLLHDGRVANRGWLQETPEPVSFVSWNSWIDLHPLDAARHGLRDGDVAELVSDAGQIAAAVRVSADVVPGVAAVPYGEGHLWLGRNAVGRGANTFALVPASSPFTFAAVTLRATGRRAPLARMSATRHQHHRDIVRTIPARELAALSPGEGEEITLPMPAGYLATRDLYTGHVHAKHRWAMVIDLHRCIGCAACTVACYAENNIPVVGEQEVERGRELTWLKIVPYLDDRAPGRIEWLPMLCQHCDAAPCEPVCPVFAAVHNEEGLNAQIYNRCIGTRYCSNNCPYKVRRFNWWAYEFAEPLQLQLNPDVTVRARGVMEKCTFCVQRIRRAEYQARLEHRPVRDGEVVPACAQTCPTAAIVFGDLRDPASRLTRLILEDPRRYQVLRELNTKPAIIYLKRIVPDEAG